MCNKKMIIAYFHCLLFRKEQTNTSFTLHRCSLYKYGIQELWVGRSTFEYSVCAKTRNASHKQHSAAITSGSDSIVESRKMVCEYSSFFHHKYTHVMCEYCRGNKNVGVSTEYRQFVKKKFQCFEAFLTTLQLL